MAPRIDAPYFRGGCKLLVFTLQKWLLGCFWFITLHLKFDQHYLNNAFQQVNKLTKTQMLEA